MKPKCPKCKRRKLTDIGIASYTHPRIVMCLCGWSRRVSRAAIIRLAVEPKKPETCKWRRLAPTHFITTCLTVRAVLDKACAKCGKPVEVVKVNG